MVCQHEEFWADVEVHRITDGEGGPVTHYYCDVKVRCEQCKETFCFIGMEHGLDPTKPMMSVLGDEARLPIRPSSEADQPLLPGSGFRIRKGLA